MTLSVKREDSPFVTYPCLMVSKGEDNYVVLFHSPKNGTVIHNPHSIPGVGSSSSEFNMNNFEHYHGKITLSNK